MNNTPISQPGKYWVVIIFLLLISFFHSCSKGAKLVPNHNEMKALVVLMSGDTVKFIATGTEVRMGHGTYGNGNFVDAASATDASISISLSSNVYVPGTYVIAACQYMPNLHGPVKPIYESSFLGNPGSITFTTLSSTNWEGYFTTSCKLSGTNDSVKVSGTFKGDLIN